MSFVMPTIVLQRERVRGGRREREGGGGGGGAIAGTAMTID